NRRITHTLPHEIAHVLGLEHLPEKETSVFPKGTPKPQKDAQIDLPVLDWIHTLMFPSNLLGSQWLNASQIERAHVGRPNRSRTPVPEREKKPRKKSRRYPASTIQRPCRPRAGSTLRRSGCPCRAPRSSASRGSRSRRRPCPSDRASFQVTPASRHV